MAIPASVSQTPPAHDQANAVVSGAFAAPGVSATFSCWGPFNVFLYGSGGPNGSWNGAVQLERSFDGGTTWIVHSIALAGTQGIWNTANKDVSIVVMEPEKGMLYRLNCTTFTGGPINYRMSTTGQSAYGSIMSPAI